MVGVGTLHIGTTGSETQYDYADMSILQTHPQEDPDTWEAVIDAAHDDVSYGDSVLIKRDAIIIFSGYVDTIEPRFQKSEGLMVYVSGPCWKGELDRRIIDQRMVGTGSDDFDKSVFVKTYPEEVMKFIAQLPQNDDPRLDPEVREGEGIYKDSWTVYIPCVVVLAAAGYTNCVSTDIGKPVLDDGGATGNLLAYNNTARFWYVDYTGTVAHGSTMTITAGTGAGTSEGASVYAGGAARKDRMIDRENEAYGNNWWSAANQTANQAILIDLGGTYHVSGIRVECRADAEDFPTNKRCAEYMRNYEIQLSTAGHTWKSVGIKANNMARDVIHGVDPTDADAGQSKRWMVIFLSANYGALWAITEIYVYKSGGTPYTTRLPVVEGDIDEDFGNAMPPINIADYMSISEIFQLITDLTTCPEGGDDATISEVLLGIYARRTDNNNNVQIRLHVWTGAAYTNVQDWNSSTDLTTSYQAKETDITATLNTLAKINNTRLKLEVVGVAGAPLTLFRISYAYLKVTVGGIQYTLGVKCRINADTQMWTTNGYEPWLEDEWQGLGVSDDDETYVESQTLNDISQGYLFRKLEGNRPWEFWVNGTTIRLLTFNAGGYTDCVSTDISLPVVGGNTGDSGTLRYYNNTTREWWVEMDANGDLFDESEAITITGGTGAGTTSAASVVGKVWNFKRRRGSDLSGSVEFKYDSTHAGGHFERIEKSANVKGILNRVKVIAGGEGIDQEVNSSDWTEDSASITANGLYEGTIDEPAIDRKETADVYAKVVLAEHKNPRNTIRVRVYDSYTSNTWGVGDEVTLTDTHTGLSGKYRVMSAKRSYGPEGEVVIIVASDSSTYLPKYRPSEQISVLDSTARGIPIPRSGLGWYVGRL